MGTSFNTWERKLGCSTLAAALLLAGIWSQGEKCVLAVQFSYAKRAHHLALSKYGYCWFSCDAAARDDAAEGRIDIDDGVFLGIPLPSSLMTDGMETYYWRARYYHKWWRNHVLKSEREESSPIPHGVIVLPLTLISAFLLPWKRNAARPISATKLVP